jgi:hypothetical protein
LELQLEILVKQLGGCCVSLYSKHIGCDRTMTDALLLLPNSTEALMLLLQVTCSTDALALLLKMTSMFLPRGVLLGSVLPHGPSFAEAAWH